VTTRLWRVYLAGIILAALVGFLLPIALPWSGLDWR
jgi:hypothetical protein